jgi:mono/diheme cytochrome c family protein
MRRTLSTLPPFVCAVLCAALVAPFPTSAAAPEAPMPKPVAKPLAQPTVPAKPNAGGIEYNRDIRPILAENCFACHGPDSAARKADLRIDQRDAAVELKAIVPGKPDESEMIRRIITDDERDVMPPKKSNKKLKPEQKELLKKWIATGAEYQAHWSFLTPTRPAVPQVKDKSWVRNPIDNFVLARLEAAGLKPAPEADRRTLARRLALDLTGLPPDPADVEEFVNDKSEMWYEKFVEKMLASPHWGEHRGRYWLDYARYADTHGIHFDNFREVWAYRDWVINAINNNQPFDQFTIDQLAGDLLPNPTLSQRVATGFNRCNITTNEGGVIPEEYVVLYARDRTETTSQVWMGLTTGCAVCHDHKYDPVTMKDFYSLSAFFNNTTQNAMDGNVHNTPPIIPVPRADDRPRFEQLAKDLVGVREKLSVRRKAAKPDFDTWAKTATAANVFAKNPREGLQLHAPLTDGLGTETRFAFDGQVRSASFGDAFTWLERPRGGKAFTVKANGTGGPPSIPEAGDFDTKQPFTASAWVRLTRNNSAGAIVARMDSNKKHRGWDFWVEGGRVGMHIINAFPEDALKVVSNTPIAVNQWVHVAVVYDGSAKPTGITVYVNGQPQGTTTQFDTLKGTTKTEVPLTVGQRFTGEGRLLGAQIEDVRLYERKLDAAEVDQLVRYGAAADAVTKPAAQRTPAETETAFGWWLVTFDEPTRDLETESAKLQAEEAAIKSRGTIAHVMNERTDTKPGAFLLFRGDYDKRRDPVTADTPKSMPPLPDNVPRNRLGLAKWLVSPEHPLTARVTVNRFWQELFGTGLVRTSGDFGIAGELPSHPELLDWLAVEFRDPTPGLCCAEPKVWDVKQFFRLLVTSATYRQAAIATSEKLDKDRDNRLMSRGPRFRMDAEMIRDQALAASGLLVRKLGGPSVKPYQPEGVWEAVAMIGSNTRDYRRDTGDNLYRRSMYTFWKRSAPPAAMEVLNAPNRETCTVRRDRTNTPLAALLTLNDVQFVEAARVLAEKTLATDDDDAKRLDFIAKRLLARPFRAEELAIINDGLKTLRAHYKAKPEEAKKLIAFGESKADPKLDASELAAWTMLANQLLNLDEVLNK